MRGKFAAGLVSVSFFVAGGCSGSDARTDGTEDPDTVSATAYATGVCGAIVDWVEDIRGLNEDLASDLDPSSLETLKAAMVGFLDDVITATDSTIGEVEDVGVPDVDRGAESAGKVLAALRDSRVVFVDARDRVAGLGTDDPASFTEELQLLGTDLQSSLSGIGDELGRFESPELDEASEDVPACDEVAAA